VSWHRPLIYVLLIHPLLYLVAALVSRRRVLVHIPVCTRHRRLRILGLVTGWVGVPAGLVGMAVGLSLDHVAAALLGLYVALTAAVLAAVWTRLLRAEVVDAHFGRLRGADLALLDRLPDWDDVTDVPA
jgi:nitrate/nitrite transporter NarK